MTCPPLYITGMACLTPFGQTIDDLLAGLQKNRTAVGLTDLPDECRRSKAPVGVVPDFSESLATFVRPGSRRKMTRLSRMSVLAAGLALKSAGLPEGVYEQTGVAFATAFGSTGQSETFFLDYLKHGPALVNPGLFPETVPNASAGQISLTYGLQGPNFTVCHQNLSAEMALIQAGEILASGMAKRMLVASAEEISPALLKGFEALGIVKHEDELSTGGITRSSRLVPGEASVALIIETAAAVEERKITPLATLIDVEARGSGVRPAGYGQIAADLAGVFEIIKARQTIDIDIAVAGGTFIDQVDRQHFDYLGRFLGKTTPFIVPEYATGNVMGAGLLRVLAGVLLLRGHALPTRRLGDKISGRLRPDKIFTNTSLAASSVLTSVVSAGGGAGMTLLAR